MIAGVPKPGLTPFKQCAVCGGEWISRTQFLSDPKITVIGYQANLDALLLGPLLFNHICGATLAINAEEFRDLYHGPIYGDRLTGSDECPGYCFDHTELARCPARCACAYIREIINIVRGWPKVGEDPTD